MTIIFDIYIYIIIDKLYDLYIYIKIKEIEIKNIIYIRKYTIIAIIY